MKIPEITPPNRTKLVIGKYDYNDNQQYNKYLDIVKHGYIAKELCVVDTIINDKMFWKYHNVYKHTNIFGNYYNYTNKSLKTYKQMLLTISEQLK